MAYEDFTTYTEVDPNSHITVTAGKCETNGLHRDEDAYVYKDFGVDHFGDIEFLCTIRQKTSGGENSCHYECRLSNDVGEATGVTDGFGIYIQGHTTYSLYLASKNSGLSSYYSMANGTVRYCKLTRSGTSVNLYVYTDAERTNLVATLSITLTGDDITSYRYLYGLQSNNTGHSDAAHITTGSYCSDLDLQELIISPSSIASAEAFGTPALKYNQTVSPSSIPSAEAFGTASVSFPQYISPTSISSVEAFGVPFVCHYVGVTSYAVSACSYGASVFLFRVGVDGHLYRRESSDNGDSWGSWVDMGDISGDADFRLASCFKDADEAVVLYSNGSTLYRRRLSGGSWEAAAAWTNSLNSITGVAVTYMGDWNVVVTGTDTSDRPGVWTCIYGDGYSEAPNTWYSLNELMIAENGSGISYHFPSLDMPDVFRLFFIEAYSGSEAYSMPYFTYSLPTADFIDNLWREPVPFNLSSEYGLDIAHAGGSVYLSCPYGYWSADLTPDDVDLTPDLIGAHLSLKPFSGALELTLRNDDGRYNAPAFTRGCDIRLCFGYHTAEGEETAGYLPITTIDSIERTLKKGRSEVILHALDGWSLLHNWIARYQYSWALGEKNIFHLLSFIFARAGIELSSYSTSSRVVNFYPAFTIHPGERGLTAVKRLLSLVEDVILFVGDTAYLIDPQSSDSADYAYGVDHKVSECLMFESTMSINLALTHSEGIAVGDYRWPEIGLVYDRLSQEFDDNIASAADAHKYGEAILREAELSDPIGAGSIIVPMNVAHDMYDVVELTVPHLGISSELYRLVAIDYYWRPERGTYNQRLLLSVV